MNPASTPGPARPTAVVLMAYGTPRSPDEILPYYTDIRRGRPPTPEALAELTARYAAIGGVSPLAERTEAQRDALQRALDQIRPGEFDVLLGLKHAAPSIEAAVDTAVTRGASRIVGLVLAPHFSALSVGQYLDRVRVAAAPHGVEVTGIESWATEPAFVEFITSDLQRRLATHDGRVRVLFTAHSLPRRILGAGDPYPAELRATAVAVAERLDLDEARDWSLAWQSAGRTPEPWLGPDILTVIDELAADRDPATRVDTVVTAAVGFVADHLEVLYDLDIEARRRADAAGLGFDRTACVNDDPDVIGALARRVVDAAG